MNERYKKTKLKIKNQKNNRIDKAKLHFGIN